MILKRTKMISSPKAAVSWAKDYCDEKSKHEKLKEAQEEKLEDLGICTGRNYFTTRPIGTLSAHGFIRPVIDQLKLAYGLDDNAAVLRYIEGYCASQCRKRRGILAIRAIASLGPSIIDPLTKNMFDLDHALVTGIEKTFEAIAAQHYPGDEIGFFLGIHHDQLTTANPAPRRSGRAPPNPARLDKANIRAHIFILPWTKLDKRISISDHNYPAGMAAGPVDMLESARLYFAVQARLSLASLPAPVNEMLATPGWTALGIMAANQTILDFRAGQEMTPTSAREFVANRMLYYLRALDKDHLKRRLKEQGERINQLVKDKKTIEDAATCIQETLTALQPGFIDRANQLRQVRDAYQASIRSPNIAVHLLRSPKAVLTSPIEAGRSFYGDLKSMFQTLAMRRKGNRITLLADIAEADLIRASVRKAYPGWMTILEKAVLSVMPNHRLLEREQTYPVEEREGMEAVGLPTGKPPEGQPPAAPSIVR